MNPGKGRGREVGFGFVKEDLELFLSWDYGFIFF